MDLFLSRQEIRRQVMRSAGYTSDALLGSPEYDRLNIIIDDASLKVAGMSKWLSLQRRASVPVDEDAGFISYRQLEEAYWSERVYPNQYHPLTFGTVADTWVNPDLATIAISNVGPGGIIEAAYWDSQKYQYIPLIKARTAARFDMDRWPDTVAETQLQDIANGVSASQLADDITAANGLRERNRGRPYSYEPAAENLAIWPIPDQRYVVRVVYSVTPTWTYNQQINPTVIDQMASVVDAKAIIYYAVSEMFAQQGDDMQSSRWEKKGMQRIMDLKGWQNTGEGIVADTEAAFDDDYEQNDRRIPNWNLGPTIR